MADLDLCHWVLASLGDDSTDGGAKALKSNAQYRKNAAAIQSVLAADDLARLELQALRDQRQGGTLNEDRLAAAYNAASDRLQSLNSRMGLNRGVADGSPHPATDTLVFLAMALGTADAEPNQLVLAAHSLRQRAEQAHAARRKAQTELAGLLRRVQAADGIDRRIAALAGRGEVERVRALAEAGKRRNFSSGDAPEIKQAIAGISKTDPSNLSQIALTTLPDYVEMEQQIKFGKKKGQEYVARFGAEREKLKGLVRVHGPSAKNYSHEDINALQSEISAINEALARKKDDIAVFQGLPPDLDLAEFRLQESKAEYEALQGQFAKLREALADRYYE